MPPRAILSGIPHAKPQVVAISTQYTTRLFDVTLQRVRDAIAAQDVSFPKNGRGPYKLLVPRDIVGQVNHRTLWSAFAQVRKLGTSNRLYFVMLKEGTSDVIIDLFCKGFIGFGQAVLRTLPWISNRKEYAREASKRGVMWNIVSTNNLPLDAAGIKAFLQEAHPDACDFETLSAKRGHVKLFSPPKDLPAALNAGWERAGCCGMCGKFGHVSAVCPSQKTACLRCGGIHPTFQCTESSPMTPLNQQDIIVRLCLAYDVLRSSWSPRAQKLLLELSSCGKAVRRDAIQKIVAQHSDPAPPGALQQVMEWVEHSWKQRRKAQKKKPEEPSNKPGTSQSANPEPKKGKVKTSPVTLKAHSAHEKSQPPKKAADPAKGKPKGCKRRRSPAKGDLRQTQMTDFAAHPANAPSSTESTPLAPPPKSLAQGKSEDGHSQESPGSERGTSLGIATTPLRAQTRSVSEATVVPSRVADPSNSEQSPMQIGE